MIELYAMKALGWLGKVPREVWYAIAAAIAFWIITGHYYDKGYDKRTAEYEALIAKAQKKAAQGAVEAEKAAQATVDAIEADNKRAREAAANSDDPLKAALDNF